MNDSNDFSEKVIWLTGATGGLGKGIAVNLAKFYTKIAIHTHQDHEQAKVVAEKLKENGTGTCITSGDLSIDKTAEESIGKITEKLGSPYALVHCAGSFLRKGVTDHNKSDFEKLIDDNLVSFFNTCRAVLPGMRSNSEGRIIGFGMAGAQYTSPMRNFGPHLAAKSGVTALARTLALEEAKHKVTVNIINPGNIKNKEMTREQSKQILAGSQFPMGHQGSFEDIAEAVIFLLSPSAESITGAVLDVNAGWIGDD